jgi:hypothetical protein
MSILARFSIAALLIALAVVGCDRSDNKSKTGPQASKDALPADLFSSNAPSDIKDLDAIRASAKDGDTVTVRGRVGGRKDPFSADRAVMTVADATLVSCDKMPGDDCPTPWDYCCLEPDELGKHVASVQVVGADSKPLYATLKNAGGLAPLKEVIIVGTVQKSPDGKAMTINASRIFVKS